MGSREVRGPGRAGDPSRPALLDAARRERLLRTAGRMHGSAGVVMMVIKHIPKVPEDFRSPVGDRQGVLIWDYGVSAGVVDAVQMLDNGGADLIIKLGRPERIEVPDDWCARAGRCRLDRRCPYIADCGLHECDAECGGCQP